MYIQVATLFVVIPLTISYAYIRFLTDMHSPTPPPIPKRPETTSHITDKHVFPYPVTPVPNWSKETMKQASHVDLINEKRRLTVELEDAKHKKMLKRDIKQLRKQIEQLENGILHFTSI